MNTLFPPPALPAKPAPAAPAPVVNVNGCGGEVGALIDSVFGPAAPTAKQIAWRESRCTASARNREGASGLFQLYRHDDILAAVCPSLSPSVSWADARCNTLAAKRLFDGSGWRPWQL